MLVTFSKISLKTSDILIKLQVKKTVRVFSKNMPINSFFSIT